MMTDPKFGFGIATLIMRVIPLAFLANLATRACILPWIVLGMDSTEHAPPPVVGSDLLDGPATPTRLPQFPSVPKAPLPDL
jgi:hypothetical protein